MKIDILYEKHRKEFILNLHHKKNIDMVVAEEIVNDAFMKFINYYDESINDNPSMLLKQILKTTMLDYFRTTTYKNMRETRSMEEIVNHTEDTRIDFVSKSRNPLESLLGNETNTIIVDVVNALEPEYRDIVNMYLDGYQLNEIGELMAIPIDTVKSRLYRTLRSIKRELKLKNVTYIKQ